MIRPWNAWQQVVSYATWSVLVDAETFGTKGFDPKREGTLHTSQMDAACEDIFHGEIAQPAHVAEVDDAYTAHSALVETYRGRGIDVVLVGQVLLGDLSGIVQIEAVIVHQHAYGTYFAVQPECVDVLPVTDHIQYGIIVVELQ